MIPFCELLLGCVIKHTMDIFTAIISFILIDKQHVPVYMQATSSESAANDLV